MMPGNRCLRVEVAYAPPGEQILVCVQVSEGARLVDAIRASGILERYPEIDLGTAVVGVFGRIAQLDRSLCDRDRVEIYRSLVVDAREARRQRARGGKAKKPTTRGS